MNGISNKKRAAGFFLAVLLFFGILTKVSNVCAAQNTADKAMSIAKGIIAWKKADNGSKDNNLINDKYLELAGTTPGDWYQIGLGRLGIKDNSEGYLAVIKDKVEERYRQPGKLSAAKATEWHRISLSVLAMGGDPTNIGKDEKNRSINLIADGTYNRGKTAPLGRQGINGWIWGLIALDSMRYSLPDDAYYTRDDIIVEILKQQLTNGGFALSGKTADPDITAMAIQALSPYYNSEKIYNYKQKSLNTNVSKAVYEVIDEALGCLSHLQLGTGDFSSWGTQNVESTDQVAVALCALGIDPLSDKRFIKNGKTLLDGILRYRMADGGFAHSYTYNSENPSSKPGKSNTMAGEQTLYTMAAIYRREKGMRTLYDFRPEQSSALKKRIENLSLKIAKQTTKSQKSEIRKLLEDFYSIPEDERSYVYNYRALSNIAKKLGIDIAYIEKNTTVYNSTENSGNENELIYFSDSDRKSVDNLPANLTTQQYALVTTLLDKVTKSEYFEGKELYYKKLFAAKEKIDKIKAEIDSINSDIKNKLYPFEKLSIKDKKNIDNIVSRYNKLSDYDKAKVERFEDVIKSKTKVDNMLRAIIIGTFLCIAVIFITLCLIKRIKKRRRKKQEEMEQLASLYSGED